MTKIIYVAENRTVIINDSLKQQHQLLNLNLGFTLLSSVLFLIGEWHPWLDFIWIFLGIFSAGLLLYRNARKSTAGKIRMEEIEGLKQKQFFGRNTLN